MVVEAVTTDPNERPGWACCTCPPPRNRAWTPRDDRYATCSGCYDVLRSSLAEVAERFLLLDPRPGATGEFGGRGAPGFASRPPLSVHIVAMQDPRSSPDARIWLGRDGRVHAESERPPLSVYGVLSTLSWSIAEHRGVSGPDDHDDVYALVRYIDRNIDYVTRYETLAVEVGTSLRDLIGQLRPVTGDARRKIGTCPAVVAQDDIEGGEPIPVRCDAPLFVPLTGSTVTCPACPAEWEAEEWMKLGKEMTQAGTRTFGVR